MLCLTTATDPAWAHQAIQALPVLLADHAHCEMKAASNALSLATRLSDHPRLARVLIALAKEELDHYDAMLAELERRGFPLSPPDVDTYAAELRSRTKRTGKVSPRDSLVDRFLVAALIEARSCERLGLIAKALEGRDEPKLAALYEELFASEARHYRTFLDLAVELSGDEPKVRARFAELAAVEGAIAARLGVSPEVHG